ncbi:MAG: Putative M24B family peptidase, partial [Anaerolineaceae bacterium 46_22]
MKSDIDRYLKENNADALWVTGAAQHNPTMVYMTGGGHMTQADVIKKIGTDPILCHA